MVTLVRSRIDSIFKNFSGKRIAVVGDLMLDRYFWGSVSRISPEAPVPVVEVDDESTRLGGAANVANNIASLGGVPMMVGVIGNDDAGRRLTAIVEESGFSADGIVLDESRPTTLKTRVIAHSQHVVRIDHEVKSDIAPEVEKKIVEALERQIDMIDGIILQDYNKGVLTKGLIAAVCQLAKVHRKTITVDPKFNNFFTYHGVTVFKPNRKEAEEALGVRLREMVDVEKAARELQKRLNAEHVLMTLGEQGMILFDQSGTLSHVSTTARNVADVSGAGDTVISTLTLALAAGATVREAATLANHAAGIVCGEVGIVPINKDVLYRKALESENHQQEQ